MALGLLLAACSGGEDLLVEEAGGTARGGDAAAGTSTSDDADGVDADGVDADAGPRLDPSVLAGQATTVAGEAFDLGELAGQDLIIWFWAPW